MAGLIDGLPLEYYAASGLINFLTSFGLCLFVYFKGIRARVSRTFALFCFAVAQWSFFYFLWLRTTNPFIADFLLRTCMIGVIFMPSIFTHFISHLLNLKINSKITFVNYLISTFIAALVYTPLYAYDGGPFLVFPYWAKAGVLFPLHLIHFSANVVYSHYKMATAIQSTRGVVRNQIKYVFIGTTIGYLAGVTNYFCWYRIPIPPFPNVLISLYVVAVAYSIVKYRLMDIRVAAVRTLVFMLVYIPSLAAPLFLGIIFRGNFERILGHNWWMLPTAASSLLAPVGLYVYFNIKNKAEALFLKEQRRYQQTLLQVSQGMTLVKDLRKLLKLIVHVVSRAIRIKEVSLFLIDKETGNFTLKAVRHKGKIPEDSYFQMEDPLVKQLHSYKAPIVLEEIRSRLGADGQKGVDDLKAIEARMDQLKIVVVVPSFVQDLLLGFLVLGEKAGGYMYTQDDLNVFEVLANQAALAIENAIFYEETGKTLAEKLQEQRIWSIGKMGAGIGHQINNRFGALSANVEITLLTYLPKLKKLVSDDGAAELIKKIEEALQTVADNAKRGGDIAKTLTNFSRKSDEFKPVDLEDAIKGALNLLSCKFKLEELNLELELPIEKPKIYGNLSMMQDIFFNILDNTHDAEVRKQHEIEERVLKSTIPYASRTVIRAKPNNGYWEIEIEDNGIGMTEDETKKLFIPFFTTKATSEKGTGLGISMMKLMIDAHKGSIKIISKYGEGTKIMLTIPIMKG